jgi:hypothetical protein
MCVQHTGIVGVLAVKRFSAYVESCRPPVCGPGGFDRAMIKRYLA